MEPGVVGEVPPDDAIDRGVLEQNIRRVLGKYFYEVTQRKPVILPVIVEV